MKYLTTLLLITAVTSAFSQKTKRITTDHGWYNEEFTVLKADKNIKHGPYSSHSRSGRLITKGFYKNDLKDSLWQEFDMLGKVVGTGIYTQGKPTGVWTYYDHTGQPENKYDHTTGQLIYHHVTRADTALWGVMVNGEQEWVRLDRPPIFVPGEQIKFRPLVYALRYPSTAVFNGIGGKVWIGYIVDEYGQVKDHQVLRPAEASLNAEAMRCVKLIEGMWLPGIYKGKPVPVMVTQVVTFNRFQ